MAEPLYCRRCGSRLPADAPHGVCPKCMLGVGFEDPEAETQSMDAANPADGAKAPPIRNEYGRRAPAAPEALAATFPHLEVLELLGRGGMGVVYKARHRELDRMVALKVLPPEVSNSPGFAERFLREARALARLNHPNIVAVHDFGQSGGQYFLLMEFVDGTNLRSLIRAGGAPPAEALAIIPQLCDALQYAHEEGVIHRDIKPENILLDRKGRVKVADFGLAKLVGPSAGADAQPDLALTAANHVLGTPRYMAPEQMEGSRTIDHRADIYSLGVVLYEMLTGEVPMGRFRAPSEKAAVDVRLDEVVLRSLEREPSHRYQHASQVKNAVAAASTPIASIGRPDLRAPKTPVLSNRRRGRGRKWVAILLAVLLLAAIPFFMFGTRRNTATEQSPLMKAVTSGDSENVWRLMSSHTASPNEVAADGVTPLMVAASKGYTAIISSLIESGASLARIIHACTPSGVARG